VIHRVIWVATDADRFAVFYADEHSAADRTIAASGRNPFVGNFLCGREAHRFVCRVGIFFAKRVESELAL